MDFLSYISNTFAPAITAFYYFWWIILPALLYFLFKLIWLDYIKKKWARSLQWTMLEIIPPKDLEKGPKPMESIFHGLIGVVVTFTAWENYGMGMFTDRFSFELVSLGGEIHFYVRVQTKYRTMVESHIYAQYPDAEIRDVEDYVKSFPKVVPNKDWQLWGADMELVEADPIPIRTYDKFEEDITGTMIDPLAGIVENMGALPPEQNLWLQFVLEPLPEKWKNEKKQKDLIAELAGRAKKEENRFWQDFVDVFSNLFKGALGPVEFKKAEKKEEQPLEFRLTPGEKEQLKAIEDNLGKNAFKTKMRFVYLGKKDGFSMSNTTAFFGAMRQFNDLNLNNIRPENMSKTSAKYVGKDSILPRMKRKIYRRYVDRDMDGKKFVLSTSELATLYHFPHMEVKTPALNRVESKRGSAPANLPIG